MSIAGLDGPEQLGEREIGWARFNLGLAAFGFLIDPMCDINAWAAFMINGELIYGLIMLLFTIVPNLHDPLQSTAIATILLSFQRGFPIKDFHTLQTREGCFEGSFSVLLGIYALMRNGYYQAMRVSDEVSLSVFWSTLCLVLSSIVLAIPAAAESSHLLLKQRTDKVFHIDSYQQVTEATKKFGVFKYIPAMDAFILGVAVGRTFSSLWLVAQLWMLGFSIGFLGWIVHATRRSSQQHTGSSQQDTVQLTFRHARTVAKVFACWPLSISRIGGDRDVLRKIREGKIGFEECALYGCASLPVPIFYSHRWFTLGFFWIYTSLGRGYEMYVDVAVDLWMHHNEGTLISVHCLTGSFLLFLLLVAGVLCLLLEMMIFLWWVPDLWRDSTDLFGSVDVKQILTHQSSMLHQSVSQRMPPACECAWRKPSDFEEAE
jgi:hypothetical protein